MKFLTLFFIIPVFSFSFDFEELMDSPGHTMRSHIYWILGDLMYDQDLKKNSVNPVYRMNSKGKNLTASFLSNGNFFAGYSDGNCYVIDLTEKTPMPLRKNGYQAITPLKEEQLEGEEIDRHTRKNIENNFSNFKPFHFIKN